MQVQVSRPTDAGPSAISRVALVLYLLDIGLSLAMPVMLTLFLYRLLYTQAPDPKGIMGTILMSWLQVLSPVFVRLWWLRLLLIFAANCTFVAWLYRAYRELARRGARTQYRPHWAITGFLVPVLNFVRPYQVVRDAWWAATGMRQQERAGVTPTPLRIKLWWALTLIVIAINFVGSKAVAPGFMELTPLALAAYIGGAAVSAFFIVVIALIEGELGRLRSGRAARVTLLGRLPLPTVASVSVVLVAALITLGVYGYAKHELELFIRAEAFAGFSPEARATARELAPEAVAAAEVPPPPPPPTSEEVHTIHERGNPPDMSGGVVGEVPGGVPGGQMGGVIGGIIGSVEGTNARPRPKALQRIRVGGNVQKALLVESVQPVYPPLARKARVPGTVTLHAIISKDGQMEHLDVLSGHPLLVPAALEAVKQWRYKPTLLNGQPVEVDTVIVVDFRPDQE